MPTLVPVSGLTGTVTVGSCALIFITDLTLELGPDNQSFHTTGGGKYPLTVETVHTGSGTINGIIDTSGLATSVFLPGELLNWGYDPLLLPELCTLEIFGSER